MNTFLLIAVLCGPIGDYTITGIKAEIKDMDLRYYPRSMIFENGDMLHYLDFETVYLIKLKLKIKNNLDSPGIYPIRLETLDVFGLPFGPPPFYVINGALVPSSIKVYGHVLLREKEEKEIVFTLYYRNNRPEIWRPIYMANDRQKPTGKVKADLLLEKKVEKNKEQLNFIEKVK